MATYSATDVRWKRKPSDVVLKTMPSSASVQMTAASDQPQLPRNAPSVNGV